MDYPPIRDYNNIIKTDAINSCPVNIEDIELRLKIFSPDMYTLKGKKVRTKQKVVVNDFVNISQELKDRYQKIEHCVDIMYIQ